MQECGGICSSGGKDAGCRRLRNGWNFEGSGRTPGRKPPDVGCYGSFIALLVQQNALRGTSRSRPGSWWQHSFAGGEDHFHDHEDHREDH